MRKTKRAVQGNGHSARKQGALLDSITVEGFKSILAQTVRLGRLNVFIGANGAGKTALLEAIGVAGAAADGRVTDDDLIDRGVRPGVPKLFKSAFAHERIPRGIKISATSSEDVGYAVMLDNAQAAAPVPWKFMSETFSDAKKPLVTRSPRGGNAWAGGKKTRLGQLDPLRGLARSRIPGLASHVERLRGLLQNFRIYDPQTAVLRGIQSDIRQVDPIGLQGGRLAEAVAFLRDDPTHYGTALVEDLSALVSWAEDVASEVPTPDLLSPSVPALREIVRFTDKYMRTDRNQLSAYDASEGALYVLFALAILAHPRAPIFFAIENIDHALHPRIARALVRKMGEIVTTKNRQVLLTTHNPLVLDGLALADDSVRLFTVERTSKGETVITRVEHTAAIAKAEASGMTLSQMWVQGVIGGIPEIA